MIRTPSINLGGSQDAAPIATNPRDEFLSTQHLNRDLRGRSVSGGIITITAQGAKFILTLGSAMVMARLLAPSDFGLIAMVSSFIGLLNVFKEAGLSTATVQREGITQAQVSNLFWVNVAVTGLITLFVACLAPGIAWFYKDARLTAITLWLSLTFLFNGSAVQHLALLRRQMRYKAIAGIEVGSMTAGVIVGIAMASLGCGYWSLVGSSLSVEGFALLLTWRISRWRPRWLSRRSETRSLLGFGANLTAAAFVNAIARGMDVILLGRYCSPAAVGLYSRASALLMNPLGQLLSPISAVFIPALSRLQNEPERYRRVFLQLNETVALVSFPMTALCLALAHPITLVLLGPKWEKAAIIFGGFALAALYLPLAMAAGLLFITQGRGKDMLFTTAIMSTFTLISFVVGLPFGPMGVALAFSISGCLIRLPIYYHIVGRSGPVSASDLWGTFFRHLPTWGLVFGSTWLARNMLAEASSIIQLLVCVPVGLLAGAAVVAVLPTQRRTAIHLIRTLRDYGKSRS